MPVRPVLLAVLLAAACANDEAADDTGLAGVEVEDERTFAYDGEPCPDAREGAGSARTSTRPHLARQRHNHASPPQAWHSSPAQGFTPASVQVPASHAAPSPSQDV
jgi:hypothetical protein